jgi:nicotinate phosphoribosyltransferase
VRDAPALGVVYKLVELENGGRREMKMKCSEGKSTYPGQKQIWRSSDSTGRYCGDLVALVDEPGPPDATPLLTRIMERGRRLESPPSLDVLQNNARAAVARLPESLLGLGMPSTPFDVRFSDRILSIQKELKAKTL